MIGYAEIIDNIYCFREGKLVLELNHCNMQGWPRSEPEHYHCFSVDCFKHGGLLGRSCSGDSGWSSDTRKKVHKLQVSGDLRKQGLGCKLFSTAADKPKAWALRSVRFQRLLARYGENLPDNFFPFFRNLACS